MTTATQWITPERRAWLDTIRFRKGAGHGKEGYCVEEALACALGLPVSDRCPDCVDSMLHSPTIRINDSWVWESDEERTAALMPLLLAQPGTATSDEAVRLKRRSMIVDHATMVSVPAWLRAAGMEAQAVQCEALPSWSPETSDKIRTVMRGVRAAASAAAYAAAATDAAAAAAAAASASAYAAAAAEAYAYAYADAAAYAAAAADADAWRKANRPLAKRLTLSLIDVLVSACAVSSVASATGGSR